MPAHRGVATAAHQVLGNNLDGTGGVNTSSTNKSYVAFRIPGSVFVQKHRTLLVYAEARKYSQNDWGGQHDLTLRRSTDDGQTFGPLLTVVDTMTLFTSSFWMEMVRSLEFLDQSLRSISIFLKQLTLDHLKVITSTTKM